MDNQYGRIYIIKNKINDKVYIGQTTQKLQERLNNHLKFSTLKTRNYKFYQAVKEIGKDNFYIELLEDNIPNNELNEKEIYYIDKFNSFHDGYNATKGGKGRLIDKTIDEEKIVNLYNNGNTTSEISKLYGVCIETICRVLKRKGVKLRENGNKYQQFDNTIFIKLWYDNCSLKEMGNYFKCDIKTIKRHANRLGLPTKSKNLERDSFGRFKRKVNNE